MSDRKGLNRGLFWLYEGHGRGPFIFRWAMLIFDFATIIYFLLAPFAQRGPHHYIIDYVIGAVILFDLVARFYIARSNLVVFVFIMAALVYVSQVRINDGINSYLDALYFTVTSLTTTGYGDVLLVGESGKLIAIIIMVLGLTLFLRLVRAILRPTDKVEQECGVCGLTRHDPDAVHCKHCGAVIHIPTKGMT